MNKLDNVWTERSRHDKWKVGFTGFVAGDGEDRNKGSRCHCTTKECCILEFPVRTWSGRGTTTRKTMVHGATEVQQVVKKYFSNEVTSKDNSVPPQEKDTPLTL